MSAMIKGIAQTLDTFLDGCEGEYRTHDMAEHVFEAMPYMVSELVWDGCNANSIFGAYSFSLIGGEWRAYFRGSTVVDEGLASDFEAAKVAAMQAVDAHYREKVMSAFEATDVSANKEPDQL